MVVLFIIDTAAMASLSTVFTKNYAEIFAFINESRLQPGKPLAFYHSYTDPVCLEVAVQVDRLPSAEKGRIKTKVVNGGRALVAHYRGPYENIDLPYNAIAQWLKDNAKQGKGLPFEIYLNDPITVTDKYKLKTEILQLLY
jgi:effector-binding domain-containing protein